MVYKINQMFLTTVSTKYIVQWLMVTNITFV
jgi:hypothetical protein